MKYLHQEVTELFLPLGVSCEELSPVKNEESSLEDSTVTLSYTYSKQADGNDYFFWYRQYPGKPPEFLFYISGLNVTRPAESLKSDTKFSTKLSEEKRGVILQISSAAVTDSAVYYCAVRPTVTGNTKTLYKNLWSKDNTILHNIH
uniref:Immunoglobulin V-set domain-containing protein n=1 Tax=Sparus aurata TaxID=8175 RepID=A0A671WGP0_SPAAU